MDYKTYLDFVLALENKREPQALSYFFRILDVKQVCVVTTYTPSVKTFSFKQPSTSLV